MASTQWGRAIESTPNGRRTIMATGRVNGLFTHGHSPGWVDTDRKIMNSDVQEGLYETAKITTLRHPYAELPGGPPERKPAKITLSGRFKVKNVHATPAPVREASCEVCFMITCECGKWDDLDGPVWDARTPRSAR